MRTKRYNRQTKRLYPTAIRRGHNVNRHDDRIKAFCMTFDEPMSWSTVAAAFDALRACTD